MNDERNLETKLYTRSKNNQDFILTSITVVKLANDDSDTTWQ
jgi:hypothetical protein